MNEVLAKGKKAKEVARELVLTSTNQKNEALTAIADRVDSRNSLYCRGKQTGY